MTEALVWLAVLALIVIAFRSIGDRRTRVGSASAGTIYDWLNQDKRKALEIVVDGQAERQDGERAEDNPPELEDPEAKAASEERHGEDPDRPRTSGA
jgi:hypothetical protein